MLQHRETRILPYTADQLFNLVMDIRSYPDFLPWCRGVRVKEMAESSITADLVIGYKVYSERFRSHVKFTRPTYINVDYLKGPLRNLQNEWHFKDLPDGYWEVKFFVEFSFKSKMLQSIASQFFDIALKKMINAFEQEAKKRYG